MAGVYLTHLGLVISPSLLVDPNNPNNPERWAFLRRPSSLPVADDKHLPEPEAGRALDQQFSALTAPSTHLDISILKNSPGNLTCCCCRG